MTPQIDTIHLLQLASGDRLSLQVYKFIGQQPGKKAYIQANLHGAEIVGNAVISQLIEFFANLKPEEITGEIWLVPVCNPLSTNQRTHFFSTGRYNPYDGKDWNRIFWDYEKECQDLDAFAQSQIDLAPEDIRKNYLEKILAAFAQKLTEIDRQSSISYNHLYRYKLQSLCLDADYVIDIHSSSNQAIDYLYCFHDRQESAKYLLFDYGILMNDTEYDGDAFDEAFIKPWLALERKLASLGKKIIFDIESWTLELGSGMQIYPESVSQGIEGIINYLIHKNIISYSRFSQTKIQQKPIKLFNRSQLKKYYAPNGGIIQNITVLGKTIERGQKLYQIVSFSKDGEVPKIIDIYAEASGLVFDRTLNQSVNQGEYILSIWEDEI
jgi:hypothetical protein